MRKPKIEKTPVLIDTRKCSWDVENTRIRLTPYAPAPSFSGPYPAEGRPVPEKEVPDGVEILGELIPRNHYEALKREGRIPLRAVMTDEELLAAIKPESSVKSITDLAERARYNYGQSNYWGFFTEGCGVTEKLYEQHFTSERKLKNAPKIFGDMPRRMIMGFTSGYRSTGNRRWAIAARDLYLEHYRVQRPPLNKINSNNAGVAYGGCGTWYTLLAGADTRTIIEFYGYLYDSPDWTARDHADFWKSMLERARFLRYTTVPFEPELNQRTFGAHNWTLYQLQGLLAIAAYFPDFIEADDWLAHATKGIGIHGDWQVLPDSGLAEYSYAYLCQVAGQFANCYDIFSRKRLPMPPRFRTNLLRLYKIFLKIDTPGKNPMPFGDTARSSGYNGASLARWASLAFLDARLKHLAGKVDDRYIDEGARVLHPENPEPAAETYRHLVPEPPSATAHIMPEIGWVVMRSGWNSNATVVAMTYGASATVGHAQPEMLGLNLWTEGVPLITKQLGFRGYSDASGFPEGFCRTARQANLVIVNGKQLSAVNGSLRDWFTSSEIDYIHADHRGWAQPGIPWYDWSKTSPSNTVMRRRLLFVKPDWVLVLDDIEGGGMAELTWQAHTDEVKPEINGNVARIRSGSATAQLFNFGVGFRTEAHEIPAVGKTIYLVVADKSGELPQRFVTLIHVGYGDPAVRKVADGVEFGEHRVSWEAVGELSEGRFLVYEGPGFSRRFTEELPEDAAEAIDGKDVDVFLYHGRPDVWPVGVAARVAWEVEEPANHSVFYRPAGIDIWQKQFHPTMCRSASVLLPDLVPMTEYEVIVVSEMSDGRVIRSPVLRGISPDKWKRY